MLESMYKSAIRMAPNFPTTLEAGRQLSNAFKILSESDL